MSKEDFIEKRKKEELNNNIIDNNEEDFDRGELLEEIDVTSFSVNIKEEKKDE